MLPGGMIGSAVELIKDASLFFHDDFNSNIADFEDEGGVKRILNFELILTSDSSTRADTVIIPLASMYLQALLKISITMRLRLKRTIVSEGKA